MRGGTDECRQPSSCMLSMGHRHLVDQSHQALSVDELARDRASDHSRSQDSHSHRALLSFPSAEARIGAAAGLAPLRVGAPETYADWARNCPRPKRVAAERPKTRIFQFVYFMPGESNFFTLKAF